MKENVPPRPRFQIELLLIRSITENVPSGPKLRMENAPSGPRLRVELFNIRDVPPGSRLRIWFLSNSKYGGECSIWAQTSD